MNSRGRHRWLTIKQKTAPQYFTKIYQTNCKRNLWSLFVSPQGTSSNKTARQIAHFYLERFIEMKKSWVFLITWLVVVTLSLIMFQRKTNRQDITGTLKLWLCHNCRNGRKFKRNRLISAWRLHTSKCSSRQVGPQVKVAYPVDQPTRLDCGPRGHPFII